VPDSPAATDGPPREASIVGPLGPEQIADPSPKCSNRGPGRTRNARRMMRNQAINLRISAVHFFRDCNAPVRVALLVVTSFNVDGGRSEVSSP
jgi:hypothetical protein